MNAKILHCLVIFLVTGSVAFYQRYHGNSWWMWALISALYFLVLVDGIGDFSKSKDGTDLAKVQRLIIFSVSVCLLGVAVSDGLRGDGWGFPLFLSLILLFFAWTAGLPDPQPPRKEPSFDRDTPPQMPFEEALFTGSDADFSYYINESFPFTDWKDDAEEILALFLPHVSAFSFNVFRSLNQTDVTLTLGGKTETLILKTSAEAAQLMESLAKFLAPEYMLCSYYFTEGSDTWANPIFSAALWDRLQRERPDRAGLFTPYIKHKTLSKGPARAST